LYLNGQPVGNIDIHGWDGPWGFGDFHPDPAFAEFAPLYNEWSRLMHHPEAAEGLTPTIADALRSVECALYAIAAKIYVEELGSWRQVGILTIDGQLIEWKEMWSGDPDVANPTAKGAQP
jgi:hypothetical protein